MKRPKARRQTRKIRPWTYDRACGALAYVKSVMQSAREHRLQAQLHDLRARKLTDRPGRPDRFALIAREDALEQAERANDRFEEALEELVRIDVYCVDPVGGVAFIPFIREDQLAWFVFDLFDRELLSAWRYHDDPLETRRPLSELTDQRPGPTLVM